jgi:hypothetical protein
LPSRVRLADDPNVVETAQERSQERSRRALVVRDDDHNHLNYLKDLAPEVGRDFKVVYSVKF